MIVHEIRASFATLTDAILGSNVSQEPKLTSEMKEDDTMDTTTTIISSKEEEEEEETTYLDDTRASTPSSSNDTTSKKQSFSDHLQTSPHTPLKYRAVENASQSLKKKAKSSSIQPFDYTAALKKRKLIKTQEDPQQIASLSSNKKHSSSTKKSRKASHLPLKLSSKSRSITFK
jgi:hypothetical protein